MRNVLFVLEPIGTGKAWRALAIAEQLKLLFPAIEPHFLAGPAAATLLRAAARFPVEDTLAPILPPKELATAQAAESGALARQLGRAARQLAPTHARETLRVARAIRAELVIVDGLFGTPPLLARAGFRVAFLTDHFLDAQPEAGITRRTMAAISRRSVVASSRLRFFVGEPSYLASPELRVWSRRFFRYTGPISGLARLNVRECATLRDELGLGRKKLVVIAAGSAFAAPAVEAALAAVDAVAAEGKQRAAGKEPKDRDAERGARRRDDIVVKLFGGPELAVDDPRTGPPLDLCRFLAIADAAIIPGGLSLLSECAGLGVPTLALPLPHHPLEQRQTDYFVNRFGVRRLTGVVTPDAIAASLREMLAHPEQHRPHDAPTPDEQRRNADFVADLLAEALGRRRPTERGAAD